VLPAYLDGRNVWVTDDAITPYVGLALLTLGGTLRLAAVFVLGLRFTGLVAIQEGHRLETGGLFARHCTARTSRRIAPLAGWIEMSP
jgi:hypothetical protein